jgi:hypothetical protein
MAAVAFDPLGYTHDLEATGVPREQAEVHAKAMTAMFLHNFDALVTTDYLDTRFNEFETRIEANMEKRFNAMEASVDQRFSSVDQQFNSVDQQFLGLESRMDVQFATINTELRWLKWLIVTCIAATVWPSLSGLMQ